MPGIYLEPAGLLYGAIAAEAIAAGGALPLAGGPVAFGAVRLWEGEPGRIKHAVVRTSTIEAIKEPRVKDLLGRITAPRAPLAGLTLEAPRIMGIVNVTPDSFSEAGDETDSAAAIDKAFRLTAEGASLIDIGGESTRPGADPVRLDIELQRVQPVLHGLKGLSVPISIDTRKAAVMKAAVEAGASVINDVSALLHDKESLQAAAALQKPVILMHAKGDPKTMQENPVYSDAVIEIYDFLESRIQSTAAAGLPPSHLVADPGIGFGKRLAHNLALLRCLSIFHGLGVTLLSGTSRKGFLGRLTGTEAPDERLPESLAAMLDAAAKGVQILRVHDVAATSRALAVWSALNIGKERKSAAGKT